MAAAGAVPVLGIGVSGELKQADHRRVPGGPLEVRGVLPDQGFSRGGLPVPPFGGGGRAVLVRHVRCRLSVAA
ncbi:hypothetical protein SSCG_06379 [Streptomyces clavuligerus]|nr:hypothetical protein SSCG_06379 [Streptomyces clavuligerus]